MKIVKHLTIILLAIVAFSCDSDDATTDETVFVTVPSSIVYEDEFLTNTIRFQYNNQVQIVNINDGTSYYLHYESNQLQYIQTEGFAPYELNYNPEGIITSYLSNPVSYNPALEGSYTYNDFFIDLDENGNIEQYSNLNIPLYSVITDVSKPGIFNNVNLDLGIRFAIGELFENSFHQTLYLFQQNEIVSAVEGNFQITYNYDYDFAGNITQINVNTLDFDSTIIDTYSLTIQYVSIADNR